MTGNRTLNCNSGTMIFEGNFQVGGSATFNMGGCTIKFNGNLARFGNANSFDPGTSTVIFGGNTEIEWNSGSDIQFYNVIVEDGASVTADVDVFVLNDMTVEGDGSYSNINNTSLNVVGQVTGDPQIFGVAPFITNISILNSNSIEVFFSRKLNQGPAENIGNYKVRSTLAGAFTDPGVVDPSPSITSAVWNPTDSNRVVLSLGFTIVADTNYYLWIQNVTIEDSFTQKITVIK
ncbi:MAG: hypothetical protein JJU41_09430 [Bacteroidetes bacterium]|nr:hypothetical protein [Bacteroidota bacterium]MCH8523709.1 hypothetical protein [Balneolales bacterium]